MPFPTKNDCQHYLTRIAYNSSGWQRPTGEARKLETSGTMNQSYGYGCEDWLFRSEWMIDGWRYGFIQGVNKSHSRLVKEGSPFHLTLYTIQPDRQWRLVATIRDAECVDFEPAEAVLKVFKQRGWYRQMEKEVKNVGGDVSGFRKSGLAVPEINIRFKQHNLEMFSPGSYLNKTDPIRKLPRYQLYDVAKQKTPNLSLRLTTRGGSEKLPVTKRVQRGAVGAVEYTPEHTIMQAQLMKQLRSEYPKAKITREKDFIDVRVEMPKELILYEIKSNLSTRTVIREALGQILEYAFHPRNNHLLPVKLVIVGRSAPSGEDVIYLERLKKEFGLPVAYRIMAI